MVSTFELYLTLRQDKRGWASLLPQFMKNLSRSVTISPDYSLTKHKLYSPCESSQCVGVLIIVMATPPPLNTLAADGQRHFATLIKPTLRHTHYQQNKNKKKHNIKTYKTKTLIFIIIQTQQNNVDSFNSVLQSTAKSISKNKPLTHCEFTTILACKSFFVIDFKLFFLVKKIRKR